MKNFIKALALVTIMTFIPAAYAVSTPQANAVQAKINAANTAVVSLNSPTLIVNNPYTYVNKNVEFNAKFNKFSTLGLDYKPAMRASQVYIGVLLERDDVGSNIIPLSELKMFMKRTYAEKFTDVESGDTVHIKGRVFSAALGDPWMDITEMKIISHKNPKPANNK